MQIKKNLFIVIYLGILNVSYGQVGKSKYDAITPKFHYPSNTIFEKFGDNFVFLEPNNQKLSITDKSVQIEYLSLQRNPVLEEQLYFNYFGKSNFKKELDLQRYIATLTQTDANSIFFESIFVNDSYIYLSVSASYWEILPTDTFQKKFYNLIRIGLDFSQTKILVPNIPEDGMEIMPFNFQTLNNIDFKFPVRSTANGKNILAKFKLDNLHLDFESFTIDSLPSYLAASDNPYIFSNFSYSYPYIGYSLFGQVYKDNLLQESIKTFEMPNLNKPGFNPMFSRNVLRQIYFYKDILHVYYTTKDSCYFTKYNTKTDIYSVAKVESIQNFNNFRYSKNYLIAYTKNNQFIINKLDEI